MIWQTMRNVDVANLIGCAIVKYSFVVPRQHQWHRFDVVI